MTKNKVHEMTYHESYQELPKSTLALVKKFNVSPMDFDIILDTFGDSVWNGEEAGVAGADWDTINKHIKDNSEKGYYIGLVF